MLMRPQPLSHSLLDGHFRRVIVYSLLLLRIPLRISHRSGALNQSELAFPDLSPWRSFLLISGAEHLQCVQLG